MGKGGDHLGRGKTVGRILTEGTRGCRATSGYETGGFDRGESGVPLGPGRRRQRSIGLVRAPCGGLFRLVRDEELRKLEWAGLMQNQGLGFLDFNILATNAALGRPVMTT